MVGLALPVAPSEVGYSPKAEKGIIGKITNVLGHEGDLNALPESVHPFTQLNPAEVTKVSQAFIHAYPDQTLRFKWITHLEPPKQLMKAYLSAERRGVPPADRLHVPRLCDVVYQIKGDYYQAVFDLSNTSKGSEIVSAEVIPDEYKPPGDPVETIELEKALLADPTFQEELKRFKLPETAILTIDPWIYGSDTREPIERLKTFHVYYRNPDNNDPDSNHYSFPIPIYPVMSTKTGKVIKIFHGPTGGPEEGMKTGTHDQDDPLGHLRPNEYMPNLRGDKMRNDIKPLLVSQPEGPSFHVEGNKIFWQKWSFIISFNNREGLVFHDVHYDNRPLFYRLSLSEMTVPYGDPRPPYHRRQAFDAGDVGLGTSANELNLGCDCLGVIKYFSAVFTRPDGTPRVSQNVVCMHEVDDGILYKHTNYRTKNAAVVRSRQLHLQIICTISNYEYIWIWKFDQVGGIHHEMRATGILSTQYIDKDKTSPYGTIVGPGVVAPNHQHLFSLRIDPMIDGEKNTVLYEDSVPMPAGEDNPYCTGWTVNKTVVKESGWVDADPFKNRVFKVINPNKKNEISKRPIGYKLVPHPSQLMLAHEGSVAYDRAEYAGHHLWVTKYRDNELFASGYWTNQSYGNGKGMLTMVGRKDAVEEEDVVMWSTYAMTHNPRIEDYPVMPYESLNISLKPADFFTANPAMDIPLSNPQENKSVLYEDCCSSMNGLSVNVVDGVNGVNGHANGANGTNGHCH